MSTAMMRPAPAIAAPLMQARPTPPQPMTATVSPGSHVRGVDHGADARHHRATDQRCAVERHVLADLHAGMLVDQHLLGERRQVQELVHRVGVFGEPRRVALLALRLGADAARHVAGQAVLAVAAERRQTSDHMVAGLDGADFGADLLDDAGRLRGRSRRAADTDRARRRNAGPSGTRRRPRCGSAPHAGRACDLHVFDRQRLVHFAKDGGFHGAGLRLLRMAGWRKLREPQARVTPNHSVGFRANPDLRRLRFVVGVDNLRLGATR